MLSTFDYIMLAAFFLFMGSLGFVFKRLNTGGTDYFAGGRKINWWMLGASTLITNFSAWSFTGGASIAYEYGVIFFLAIAAIDIIGYTAAVLWFAPRFRRLRLVTAMDAVRLRFCKKNEQLFSWLQILTNYLSGAIWLVALSVLISAVFNIGQIPVIVASTLTILVLASLGGKWGVTAGDFIQTILLLGCVVVVAVFTLIEVGGIGAFISKVPEMHWDVFRPLGSIKYDWLFLATGLIWGLYQKNSIAYGAAKYIASKDCKHARWSAWIPLVGYLTLPIFWFIPAVGALMIVPDLMTEYSGFKNPTEASYIAVCVKLLPSGMLGLMVAALFASTLSSMDAGININAGFLIKNFYQPIFRKNATEQELLFAGQFATILSCAIMMSLAILLVSVGEVSLFDAYLYINAYIQAPLTVAMFMGMITHRTPSWAGWTSVLFGIGLTVILFDLMPTQFMTDMMTPIWGEGFHSYLVSNKFTFTNIITIPLTSLFFLGTRMFYRETENNKEYTDRIKEFSRRLKTPVDFEKEVGNDNTKDQAQIIGRLCLGYGAFIMLGVFIPNPMLGRFGIAFCATLMLAVGFSLWLYAKKLQNKMA